MLLTYLIILIVFNLIFLVGLLGFFFIKKSNFFIIISIEIIVLSLNLNFVFYSIMIDSLQGLIMFFYIMVISAAELALLLSFFIVFYKKVYLLDLYEKFKNIKY